MWFFNKEKEINIGDSVASKRKAIETHFGRNIKVCDDFMGIYEGVNLEEFYDGNNYFLGTKDGEIVTLSVGCLEQMFLVKR